MIWYNTPDPPAIIEVVEDHGGFVREYFAAVEQLRNTKTQIKITGTCESACTLIFALPPDRICVDPLAKIGFHRAKNIDDPDMADVWSEVMWNSYPDIIRQRLQTLTKNFKYLMGQALIPFYSQCK